MRKRLIAASAIALLVASPSPAFAWGFVAHRYIMSRAIDLLPPALKLFFEHYRAEVVVRVVDPDTWREAGWDENANHFVDFGAPEFGPYPFTALPREYGAAVEKFGMATLKRTGLLPWRTEEMFGNLRRAFEGFKTSSSYAVIDTILFSSATSHYVGDAYVPLHAALNYDGQTTGQWGIHSRFEDALFRRYQSKLTVSPGPVSAIVNPRDAMFDTLLASYQLADQLLAADKDAVAGKTVYDDDYFDKLFARLRPMMEKQLAASITATASIIVGAWQAAGSPALRTEMPDTPQRVRRSE